MKAESRIISKRCMVVYIPGEIFRSSFKFCMGDKVREKMEGGKRDEKFFSALQFAQTFTNCVLKNF
jgi:hypothetical protein